MASNFERKEHLYKNEAFGELVKDAVRFFNGTPVHTLPPPNVFLGTGVYALYYTGQNPTYGKYAELNRLAYLFPIYVGKAVPTGWRQARVSATELNQSNELFRRLREHSKSISCSSDLILSDFSCRFIIFESETSDMISTIEAALIKLNRPLWNTGLDGFGNHDPGSGRYEQAMSDWDALHPGRSWAYKCNGKAKAVKTILANVEKHFKSIEDK